MKKFAQRFAALPLLLAVASSTVISPVRDANALVGALVSSTPVLVVGGLITASGAGSFLYEALTYQGSERNLDLTLFAFLFAIPVSGMGLLVLDAQNGQNVTFSEIRSSDNEKFGLTNAELDAYNFEALDRLNLLAQEAASAIASAPKGEERNTSTAVWAAGLKELSPEAQSAVHKLFSKRN